MSDEVKATLTSECVVPDQPRGLDIVGSPVASAGTTTARWFSPSGGAAATGYVVEVGSASGGTDVGRQLFASNPDPQFGEATGLPAGSYFGRVRAQNVCGSGPASSEVTFKVGEGCRHMLAPSPLRTEVSGQTVTLRWPTGGSKISPSYPDSTLEIGTSQGASDVFTSTGQFTDVPLQTYFFKQYSTTLAPGHYFARVRLKDACGTTNPSMEAEFTIAP